MPQIHVVLRRVNPALKIDLAQVGHFEDRQFSPLPFSAVANSPIACFLKSSDVSDSLYVNHSDISKLIAACDDLPCFSIEFFDNTLVLMFDYNLDGNESATEEEGKGN